MITTEQKQLIKATVPILREHGVLLTTHFYKRMFDHNPELKNVFNMGNQQNGRQQTALAMAVLAYAENIDNPAVLMPVIGGIGNKHVSLDIRPEHYQIVGKHLLASISEVLGDTATPEIIEAWSIAYGQLAQIMAGHETELYNKQVQKPGGWTGWRPFVVKTKKAESAEITSFYLYPADGGTVADFTPGQYLSIRLFLPQLNLLQPRQYSISSAPNGLYYRISVKKESATTANPSGIISNHLHTNVNEGDVLELSAPAGNFLLDTNSTRPMVFISGGVGQTPLMSMLESLIEGGNNQPKTWIHGCRDEKVHAFKEVIDTLTERKAIESHIFYDETITNEQKEGVYKGWVDLNEIDADLFTADAVYYICGPAPFIKKHYNNLRSKGVEKASINFEEFGPQVLQLN